MPALLPCGDSSSEALATVTVLISDEEVEKKYWKRVELPLVAEGCWKWTGSIDGKGRGRIHANGGGFIAARVAWMLFKGLIPDGMCVLHKCDNPICVKPDHLFLGTMADNMIDMRDKGRSTYGEKHGMAKILNKQVKDILQKLAQGATQQQVADEYGVSRSHISHIAHGKRRRRA